MSTASRVTVLGGTGFLGSKVVTALSAVPGLDLAVASRRGPLAVDVTKPASWEALRGTALLVDLSDATSTPPDALVAWCLEQGIAVLETTSDAPCVERLMRAHQQTRGQLILGGGIFTGVSNLLARAVAKRVGAVERLTLGIATSPFSGAGRGTIELMVRALAVPAVRYVAGTRTEVPGITAGPRIDFGGTTRSSLRASLAEPPMLAASTGAKQVDAYFSPKPAALVPAFRLMPAWLVRTRVFQAFLRAYFTVLRRFLLGSVGTAVELSAVAQGAQGEARATVAAKDGMLAAAWAIAAMVESVLAKPAPGLRFIDDVAALDEVVARANALAGAPMLEAR